MCLYYKDFKALEPYIFVFKQFSACPVECSDVGYRQWDLISAHEALVEALEAHYSLRCVVAYIIIWQTKIETTI